MVSNRSNDAHPPPDNRESRSPIDVLVVEDSPSQRALLLQMLNGGADTEFRFKCVERIEEGIRNLGERQFDVAMLDLMLPDSQGLESFLRLHARHPGVPIVVLTGIDDKNIAADALRSGAQDYLVKGELTREIIVRSLRYAIERHRRQRAELRVLRAQQDERRRLARELHDGVIQSLNAIRLQLQVLDVQLRDGGSQTANVVQTLAAEALSAIDEVRRVSHDLHPSALDHRELPAALASYAESLRKESGLEIEISNHCTCPLSDHAKDHLYRIVQECLRNVVKHAGASQLQVNINNQNHIVAVEVRDDGKGFDVEATESSGRGLGLMSIRERALLLGGTARIESHMGVGTIVHIEVPV